jgi:glutathione reductase (NADPH)
MKFDLVVIGGGSGGIASAIRATKHGAKVAVVEKNHLGGTCVNLGCVPKKIMYNAATIRSILSQSIDYGFSPINIKLDWSTLVSKRNDYIARLRENYTNRFASLGITLIKGHGQFVDNQTIKIAKKYYQAPHILIATGSEPTYPNGLVGIEHAITSDGFFALRTQPKKVAIIGSGYVGIELAGVLHGLGSETHLLLRGAKPLSHFDTMLGETLLEIMIQQKIHVHTHYDTQSITLQDDGRKTIRCQNNTSITDVDCVIIATGRSPKISGLGLDKTTICYDKQGFIDVDQFQNSTLAGVYAIGDVINRPALTPVAIAAGRRLSDRLFGKQPNACLDYQNICSVVFSHPPIGSVGFSEADACSQFGFENINVYQTRFNPMFDALSRDKTPTVMKLVTHGREERIIGIHLIGANADEMLQGFGVAVRMGACKRDFDDTVAIHPTSAEELVTMI